MSLYDDLGGTAAVSAALGQFYPKVLADPRTSAYFKDVDIEGLKKRVEPFLVMALGGPNNYHGPGLQQAHAPLVARGLNDSVFDVFLGPLPGRAEGAGRARREDRRGDAALLWRARRGVEPLSDLLCHASAKAI